MKLLKIFSNFGKSQVETKPVLNKIENIFKNSNSQTLESHNYRTLIDTDFHPEDIFKDLDKTTSSIPNQSLNDKNKITLFVPLDEFLCHAALPDINLGMVNVPNSKNYDFKLDLPEYRSFAYVYIRKNLKEFLEFIDNNFEPILYTKGEKTYVDKIMDIIDEKRIFRYRLYQSDCHLYKNVKQDVVEYFRDIHLFNNRSLKRKIIIDFRSLNNILQPDNTITVEEYFPDDFEEDEELIDLSTTLQNILETNSNDDVRDFIIKEYQMRTLLINSKLL